jgi:putative SOS response-associated peptidase YedK
MIQDPPAMCGRTTLTASGEELAEAFDLPEPPALPERYNIAPTQDLAIVRVHPRRHVRSLDLVRWGLVPRWMEKPTAGSINARAEGVATRPKFRESFRHRRCLVPSSGFYEWRRERGQRQPYLIRRRDRALFAFGGLWDRWRRGNTALESCAILTTRANELVVPIHDRMPLIVPPSSYGSWLDPTLEDPERLEELLLPFPPDELEAIRVSTLVNKAANDGPELIEPRADDAPVESEPPPRRPLQKTLF